MGAVSVAQAAERLGVSVPRIHQRIANGSLSAERIGSQRAVNSSTCTAPNRGSSRCARRTTLTR